MALNNKKIKIGEREIEVKQLSFMKKINLMKDNTNENLIKLSISENDYEYLDSISLGKEEIEGIKNLFEAINEVNSWNVSDDSEVFQEKK